jgi:hypothetical protein
VRRAIVALAASTVGSLFAFSAQAQVQAAVAAGTAGAVGGLARTQSEPAPLSLGTEPPDWLDPQTQSASNLARGCGVVSEVTLTVTPGSAFLNVLVSNTSREVLAFDAAATRVLLDGRGKRRVRTQLRGSLNVPPNWWQWLPLQLPSKSNLDGISWLEAELVIVSPSFGRCIVKNRIVRPPGPRRAESVTPYTLLELGFGLGPRFLTTGALHEIAPKPGVSFGLDLDVFWSVHHGARFVIAGETAGRAKGEQVAPSLTFEGKPVIEAAGFFLGYVARFPLTDWLSLTYSPQVGWIPFQLVDGGEQRRVKLTSSVFSPRQSVRLSAPFAHVSDGSFFGALSVSHTYVPYGRLGEVELRGNLLSALLMLGVSG